MLVIMRNRTPIINCQDMQTAIRYVQALESELDRRVEHSPYTILPETDSNRPHASVNELNTALAENIGSRVA